MNEKQYFQSIGFPKEIFEALAGQGSLGVSKAYFTEMINRCKQIEKNLNATIDSITDVIALQNDEVIFWQAMKNRKGDTLFGSLAATTVALTQVQDEIAFYEECRQPTDKPTLNQAAYLIGSLLENNKIQPRDKHGSRILGYLGWYGNNLPKDPLEAFRSSYKRGGKMR